MKELKEMRPGYKPDGEFRWNQEFADPHHMPKCKPHDKSLLKCSGNNPLPQDWSCQTTRPGNFPNYNEATIVCKGNPNAKGVASCTDPNWDFWSPNRYR